MNGQGWPFKGRTGQDDPSNRCHQVTTDEGSRAATTRPGCTFFSLVFFVHAKKSNPRSNDQIPAFAGTTGLLDPRFRGNDIN